jgi:GAF domain-containing protein
VLSLASGLVRELAPASTIGWYVVDEASGYLTLRHAYGPAAGRMRGTALRLGEGLSGWVAANRQVMINSEASLDLGELAHAGSPVTHALCVPLITRESLVGTITLYSDAAFSESQSRLVQVIAPHLAQAVWSAKRTDTAAHGSQAPGARAAGASHSDLRLVAAR